MTYDDKPLVRNNASRAGIGADLEDDLAALFEAQGFTAEAGRGLAQACLALSRTLAREALLDALHRLRASQAGAALLLAVAPEAEPLRAAARRLRISPAALLREIRKARAAITNG